MNWYWLWRFLILWNRSGEPRYFGISLYDADHETPVIGFYYDACHKTGQGRKWK